MKKGFTLIELLAVIVILAIIALIATPIVLNIINDSRKESIRLSAENYIDAVEVSLANAYMKDNNILLSDTYEISENGKKLISQTNSKEISVEFDGTPIKEGKLKIEKGNVEQIKAGRIDNWNIKLEQGSFVLSEILVERMLINGETFNSKIKTLANNTNKKYNDEDSTIESIEFLSGGKLPEGYTKEELKKISEISSVDVSNNNDGTIIAIYDEGKIFVYSEDLIKLNNDCSGMFAFFYGLTSLDLSSFDTSNVTDMSFMFYGCDALENLNISEFDTSKVTDMSWMFFCCWKLAELDVSKFDTSKVTDMSGMFYGCSGLTKLAISKFDTSSVNNMWDMFSGCTNLTNLDVSNFDTRKVTNMSWMFQQCEKLTNLDLSSFNINYVTNMSYMFADCINLTEIKVSNNWNLENVNIDNMFTNCGTNSVHVID